MPAAPQAAHSSSQLSLTLLAPLQQRVAQHQHDMRHLTAAAAAAAAAGGGGSDSVVGLACEGGSLQGKDNSRFDSFSSWFGSPL
jgi:hypothetical protein